MCPELTPTLLERSNLKIRYYSFQMNGVSSIEEELSQTDAVLVYVPFGLSLNLEVSGNPKKIYDSTHQLGFTRPVDADFEFASLRKYLPINSIALFRSKQDFYLPKQGSRHYGKNMLSYLLKNIHSGDMNVWCLKKFRENEAFLSKNKPRLASKKSQHIIRHLDLGEMAKRRLENYSLLHTLLADHNQLSEFIYSPTQLEFIPYSYPFLQVGVEDLRSKFFDLGIYTSVLWPGLEQAKLNEFENR